MNKVAVYWDTISGAILGGSSRYVFFDGSIDFLTTKDSMQKARRFSISIAEKCGLPKKFVNDTLALLPIRVVSSAYYRDKMSEASKAIKSKDRRQIAALALKTGCLLTDGTWASKLPIRCVAGKGLLERWPLLLQVEG